MHRHDADENRGEKLGHFLDRRPGKVIGGAVRARRQRKRDETDRDQRAVAQNVLQGEMGAENIERNAGPPDTAEEDRADGGTDERDIGEATHTHRRRRATVRDFGSWRTK